MKQLLLLLFTSACFAVSSQITHENQLVRIEPNGVQVYEAKGNENSSVINQNPVIVQKTINDWTLVECQDALYFIDLKIESIKESGVDLAQIAIYEEEKSEIVERKQFLISNK